MTSRRFLAFDIETAKLLPDGVDDLLAHRPLGICCAAAFALDSGEPMSWCGRDAAGRPAPRLSRAEAASLVSDLSRLVEDGYTLVTWNGAAFDFPILAEESGATVECVALAAAHVDMMFHVVCSQGHRLSLQKAAQGMSLPGKLSGVSGAEAPRLWADGEHEKVLAYCAQDVLLTAELAAACERASALRWVTQRGKPASMPLPRGWLDVRQAERLPQPDTSWMSSPPSRVEMTAWMRS